MHLGFVSRRHSISSHLAQWRRQPTKQCSRLCCSWWRRCEIQHLGSSCVSSLPGGCYGILKRLTAPSAESISMMKPRSKILKLPLHMKLKKIHFLACMPWCHRHPGHQGHQHIICLLQVWFKVWLWLTGEGYVIVRWDCLKSFYWCK